MAEEEKVSFPAYRILTTKQLAQTMKESNANGSRYCFILGSGASVESGIPGGASLEMRWMNCMMGLTDDYNASKRDAEETRRLAAALRESGIIKHDFNEIEAVWRDAVGKGEKKLPSKYYFDLYRLRFYPEAANGYRYMEKIMSQAEPSIGYHALALLLAETKDCLNNLLITTNFDNLAEDALRIYSDSRPLVAGHESLAGYIALDAKHPIIAKVHRSLFFEPFNTPEETGALQPGWKPALSSAFRRYATIVIGYAGGDESLMAFLEEDSTEISQGLYWCFRGKDLPDDRILTLVKKKQGYLVRIDGFDAMMLTLGTELFGSKIGPTETDKLLKQQYDRRMSRYTEQWNTLNDKPETAEAAMELNTEEQQKAEERKKHNNLTAWDYFSSAYAEAKRKHHDKAISDYSKVIELNPENMAAYNNRGNSFADLQRYNEAIADYDKAIELNPEFAEAYNNRGNSYAALQRYDEAIADYDKAIELNPEYAEAYNNRGNSFADLQRYNEAIADYDKAIELNPEYAEAYNNRGTSYADLQRYNEAIADYDKAIELNPKYGNSYNNLGNALRFMGRPEEALTAINRAIELEPNEPIAHPNKGIILEDLARPEESLAEYETAKRLFPGIFELYTSYWAKLAKAGRDQDALEAFTRVLRLEPEHIDAYRHRAELYRKLGETALAEADEAKVKELDKKGK